MASSWFEPLTDFYFEKTKCVSLDPVPWARARQNGKRFFSTSKVSTQKQAVQIVCGKINPLPVDPVEVEIIFFMPIPESKPKWWKKHLAEIKHIKKPDIDNLAKLVLDALNGFWWQDDTQVFRLILEKRYDEKPRTEITARFTTQKRKLHE